MKLTNFAIWKEHVGKDGKIISRQLLDVCKQFDMDQYKYSGKKEDCDELLSKFYAFSRFKPLFQKLSDDGKWIITSRLDNSEQYHYILVMNQQDEQTQEIKTEAVEDFYLFGYSKPIQFESLPYNKYDFFYCLY